MPADVEALAAEALASLDGGRPLPLITKRHPDFSHTDAYAVTAAMRRKRLARGEKAVGRKIGFTNRTIWAEYGADRPMWGYLYNTTVRELAVADAGFPLAGLAEPRIEPEIVFGLARTPAPGLDDAALFATIGWVAHGFEIVQSIFPGWRFTIPDTIAANGLHGALLIGPRIMLGADNARWLGALASFDIELRCNGAVVDRGRAANVLDGPLNALRHLIDVLATETANPPLGAGEIVTTGTLTRALPVKAGETWSTALSGVDLPGISVRFA
jgi:2-oxo-3-hexenedioate decarboxylase